MIRRGLGGRVRTVRRIRRLLVKRRVVRLKRTKHFVSRHVNKAKRRTLGFSERCNAPRTASSNVNVPLTFVCTKSAARISTVYMTLGGQNEAAHVADARAAVQRIDSPSQMSTRQTACALLHSECEIVAITGVRQLVDDERFFVGLAEPINQKMAPMNPAPPVKDMR